jgi:hypothetical protein
MKTSELTDAALDWAVEIAKGTHWSPNGYFVFKRPTGTEYVDKNAEWRYSTDWSQGGPIIEREELSVEPQYTAGGLECWVAYGHNLRYDDHGNYIQGSDNRQYAPTPLIAAMRCYVASKLGDEVEVPDEMA